MRSTATVMALAAVGLTEVLAGPTHAHLHRQAHAKKDTVDTSNVDWNSIQWQEIGVDWAKINYGSSSTASSATATATSVQASVAAVVSPATTTTASASSASSSSSASSAASSSASPSSSGQFTGLFEGLWHNLQGCANNNKAFGAQSSSSGDYVSYISNVGSPVYGSNMMFVSDASAYDYTMTFINTASAGMTVNCWNKPGMDGQPNSGATDAPKRTTLTFNLDVGQSAIVAVDENTVLACCEAVDRFDFSGAFAQTWIEAKFKKNDSGFDVSKILNTGPDYKVSMCAQETDCCSTETANNWITETQTTGSGSCYIPSFGAHLTIKMSGTA